MKSVILLHDAFTNPTGYWYESIKSTIPAGYQLITPELSTGSLQGYSYWMKSMEQYKDTINEDTIFISHGISSLLLFRMLESVQTKIRSSIIIAGTGEAPSHKVYAPIAETFLQTPIDWKLLQTKTETVFHIWNAKDPFVDPQLSKQLSELLPGKTFPLSGTEHFSETNEPELFSVLETIFKKFGLEDTTEHYTEMVQQETQQKKAIAESTVPGMETYDSDVAASVAGYQGAVISELLSEARKQEKIQKEKSPTSSKNLFYIIGTFILLVIGFSLFAYTSIINTPTKVPVSIKKVQYASSLLRTETTDPIDLGNDQQFALLKQFKDLQTKEIESKTFQNIVPVLDNASTNFETFAQKLELKFPLGFAGKATDFVYGFYNDPDQGKIPFLLVRFEGYDILHSIMSTWEPNMLGDTLSLFSTDAPSDTLLKPETATFHDNLVNNLPMRTGENTNGQQISYGFLSDQTLLITSNPAVTEPIVRRLIGR